MVADDSDYSDNEIYDEVWPEDYFASDVEDCSLEALDLNDPSPAELVPIEILRKIVEPLGLRDRCSLSLVNRAFRKAVQASTWHVHRLAITSNEEDVPRNRSRFNIIVDGQVKQKFACAEECVNELTALSAKFEKLHVHLLVLNNVLCVLDSSSPFYELLNNNRRFSFAVLEMTSNLAGTAWITKDERIASLAKKATTETVVIKHAGPTNLLTRPRDSFPTNDSYLEYVSHLYSVVS
ncbi:hypothetical protein PRIPAC_76556 [Pristionchus pacificus]|nr:hypothetical protein PRIPAC_76556 [Pristionchus pacificus]